MRFFIFAFSSIIALFRVGCSLFAVHSDVFNHGGIVGQKNLRVAVSHTGDVFLAILFNFLRFLNQFKKIFVAAALVSYPDFDQDVIDLTGLVDIDDVIGPLPGVVADSLRYGVENKPENGHPFPVLFPVFVNLSMKFLDIVFFRHHFASVSFF